MNARNIGMNRTQAEDLLESIAEQGGNLPIYIVRVQTVYKDEDDVLPRWAFVGGWLAVTNSHKDMVAAVDAFQLEPGYRVIVDYIAPWDALETNYNGYLTTYATKEPGRDLVCD